MNIYLLLNLSNVRGEEIRMEAISTDIREAKEAYGKHEVHAYMSRTGLSYNPSVTIRVCIHFVHEYLPLAQPIQCAMCKAGKLEWKL